MGAAAVPCAYLLLTAFAVALLPAAVYSESVVATAETDPVPSPSDAADDPAIWVHPSDPAQSVVIGTDKQAGIAVYDLAGIELQFRYDGELNNVDVRYGFPLGGTSVDIAAASNRTTDTLSVYAIDADSGLLAPITAGGGIPAGIAVYGLCLYASSAGPYYAFVNSQEGQVEQWELFDDGTGFVTGALVRSFDVGDQTEGCVADDILGTFYIGEEATGIWRYGAEPGDGETRSLVDSTGPAGHLDADVEGLALFYLDAQAGYLIASSQGDDTFAIYDRQSDAWLGSFSIDTGTIDAVTGTDGIDVISASLGTGLGWGLFVAQDGKNQGGRQNFKLVPWDDIALAFDPPLATSSSWDPRAPVAVPALSPWMHGLLASGLLLSRLPLRTRR
jgi:3-phytase